MTAGTSDWGSHMPQIRKQRGAVLLALLAFSPPLFLFSPGNQFREGKKEGRECRGRREGREVAVQ